MKLVNLELLLPEDIPEGEQLLWFGRPDFVSLGRRAFRGDLVIAYFAVMAIWNFWTATPDQDFMAGLAAALKTCAIGALGLGLLFLLSWLSARTTLYVVTSKRIVMKVGIALPVFFNIPFKTITNASYREYADHTGDIPVTLAAPQRIAYLHLWPHARPFNFKQPQPALRCIPEVAKVAAILAEALTMERNFAMPTSTGQGADEPDGTAYANVSANTASAA